MRQAILLLSFFLLTIGFGLPGQAQVTFTQNDFPRLSSFVDSFQLTLQTGIEVPAEGPDQVWDYSALQFSQWQTIAHFDATNDTGFPNALNYREADLIFQGFYIVSNSYEGLDAEGWYDMGKSITDVTYSITAISGGPNDSLRFVGKNDVYQGRINLVKFPMTYPDQWTQTRIEQLDFELTVAAFGLDKTPGFRQRTITQDREIVGYGELSIPKSDGSPSLPMDVLQLKVDEVLVDSFFLGGDPAPESLLTAFGLTQGNTVVESYYVFYSPDFGSPVLNINISANGEVLNAFYRPQSADNLTSLKNLDFPELRAYPNPVKAGESIYVQLNQLTPSGSVSLMDMAGRLVSRMDFASVAGDQLELPIPSTFSEGMYFYQVHDQKGSPVGLGKLLVH